MQAFVIARGGRTPIKVNSSAKIKAGGAGTVYAMSDVGFSNSVVKIYHDPAKHANRAKLAAMLANPPTEVAAKISGKDYVQFAWPTHLVEDQRGVCIGFVMPKIDMTDSKPASFYTETRDSQTLTADQRSIAGRLSVCANLAALLENLHNCGHAFIDIKFDNIRLFPKAAVCSFIDCDGYRIVGKDGTVYPGEMATQEFYSPELIKNKNPKLLGEPHDRFALAVLMFKILNFGVSPFQGIPLSQRLTSQNSFDPLTYIAEGLYPYGHRKHPEIAPQPASVHESWDIATLSMFSRAFTAQTPEQRPKASEWRKHFRSMLSTSWSEVCSKHPKDVEHIHFKNRPCHMCLMLAKVQGASVNSQPGISGSGLTGTVISSGHPSAGSSAAGSQPPGIQLPPPEPFGTGKIIGLTIIVLFVLFILWAMVTASGSRI